MVRFVFFMNQHAMSEENISRQLHGTVIAPLKFEVYCNKSQFHGDLDDLVAVSFLVSGRILTRVVSIYPPPGCWATGTPHA
jgi:hypothetical protein